MKHSRRLRFLAGAFLFAAASVSALASGQGQSGMPPMPKPGPEHAVLASDAGTWDAVIETVESPGAKPNTSKGVETNTMGCGGLCLISDFKGEMMPGMKFEGHGITVWDPAKKKYVGSWTDSTSMGLMVGESTYDPATKTFTGVMEGPDMTGNVMKMRSTSQQKDPDHRVMTMFAPGPDGKDFPMMRITYTRRK